MAVILVVAVLVALWVAWKAALMVAKLLVLVCAVALWLVLLPLRPPAR
jgi:hypothetical protein